jgi:hypothetical protein
MSGFEHLPPSPYDLGPPDEPEPYYRDTWTVHLYERARPNNGQRTEIDAWVFTDEEKAKAHADKVIEDPDLDHEEYLYTVVIEEGQQECEPPEPDWDNAPGGHDDI